MITEFVKSVLHCILLIRTAMARGKAESADQTAAATREDMSKARVQAKLYAPSFYQPGETTNRISNWKTNKNKSLRSHRGLRLPVIATMYQC